LNLLACGHGTRGYRLSTTPSKFISVVQDSGEGKALWQHASNLLTINPLGGKSEGLTLPIENEIDTGDKERDWTDILETWILKEYIPKGKKEEKRRGKKKCFV